MGKERCRRLINEARRGADGCEGCTLLAELADALNVLWVFTGKVADYSNDGWLAREAYTLRDA